MLHSLLTTMRRTRADRKLPALAKAERERDRMQGLGEDPGAERAVAAALDWLRTAQDRSRSADGGVARHFSLVDGWSTSYPETTGYIVPTMLRCAERFGDADLERRGRRMLDWLVSIQRPDGGFQGGVIGATPVVSVTFNTGQILLGLAEGVARYGEPYRAALRGAGDFLAGSLDPDGCWRRHPTPFAAPGEKAYETHVAWGLLEAARVEPDRGYAEAALRNIDWALGKQQVNGWFGSNCLQEPDRPLTHTIGYVLRGVLEGHRYSRDPRLLAAARTTAESLLRVLQPDGFLPGRLEAGWRGAVEWACLTGTVQIAHCWLMLHEETGDERYLEAASRANRYVRRTMRVTGPSDTLGAVKGSFPVDGSYGRYQYLNWACKFFIDAHLLEADLRRRGS